MTVVAAMGVQARPIGRLVPQLRLLRHQVAARRVSVWRRRLVLARPVREFTSLSWSRVPSTTAERFALCKGRPAKLRVAAHQLLEFLTTAGLPTGPMEITRQGVQDFVTDVVLTRSAATASTRYWGLRAFFNWLVDEGEIDHSPRERVRPVLGLDGPS